jgi:hypothetical protein
MTYRRLAVAGAMFACLGAACFSSTDDAASGQSDPEFGSSESAATLVYKRFWSSSDAVKFGQKPFFNTPYPTATSYGVKLLGVRSDSATVTALGVETPYLNRTFIIHKKIPVAHAGAVSAGLSGFRPRARPNRSVREVLASRVAPGRAPLYARNKIAGLNEWWHCDYPLWDPAIWRLTYTDTAGTSHREPNGKGYCLWPWRTFYSTSAQYVFKDGGFQANQSIASVAAKGYQCVGGPCTGGTRASLSSTVSATDNLDIKAGVSASINLDWNLFRYFGDSSSSEDGGGGKRTAKVSINADGSVNYVKSTNTTLTVNQTTTWCTPKTMKGGWYYALSYERPRFRTDAKYTGAWIKEAGYWDSSDVSSRWDKSVVWDADYESSISYNGDPTNFIELACDLTSPTTGQCCQQWVYWMQGLTTGKPMCALPAAPAYDSSQCDPPSPPNPPANWTNMRAGTMPAVRTRPCRGGVCTGTLSKDLRTQQPDCSRAQCDLKRCAPSRCSPKQSRRGTLWFLRGSHHLFARPQ